MTGRNITIRQNTQELPGFAQIYRDRDKKELPTPRKTISPHDIALNDFRSAFQVILAAFTRIEETAITHEKERHPEDHKPYEQMVMETIKSKLGNLDNTESIKGLRAVAVLISHKIKKDKTGTVDLYRACHKALNAGAALMQIEKSDIPNDLGLINLNPEETAIAINALMNEVKASRNRHQPDHKISRPRQP